MSCTTCVDKKTDTGRSFDSGAFGEFKGVILAQMVASDSTPNVIDLDAVLDQAFWDNFLNNPDYSKRGFPIRDVRNPDSPVLTKQERTFSDGTIENLGVNARIINSLLNNATNEYLDKIENIVGCGRWGVYYWDDCPRLKGNVKTSPGNLSLIEISKDTFLALLDWARAGANSQDIILTWNHPTSEKDSSHGYITNNTFSFDLLNTEGVTGVNIVDLVADAATDTITFKAETCFGDHGDLNGVPAFEESDFVLTIDGIAATVDTFTNNGDGTYAVVVNEDLVAQDVFVGASKLYFAVEGATVPAA